TRTSVTRGDDCPGPGPAPGPGPGALSEIATSTPVNGPGPALSGTAPSSESFSRIRYVLSFEERSTRSRFGLFETQYFLPSRGWPRTAMTPPAFIVTIRFLDFPLKSRVTQV